MASAGVSLGLGFRDDLVHLRQNVFNRDSFAAIEFGDALLDIEHLLTLINDVRSIPGVRDTETFVYLKLVKQTYTWGTP